MAPRSKAKKTGSGSKKSEVIKTDATFESIAPHMAAFYKRKKQLYHIRKLRILSKKIKDLVAPFFTRLEVIIDHTCSEAYEELTAASFIENITDMAMHLNGERESYSPEDTLEYHKDDLLKLLKKCAPKLEHLAMLTYEQDPDDSDDEYSLPGRLIELGATEYSIEYPKLKSLHMHPLETKTIPSIESSLFAMTSLETLKLPEELYGGFVTAEGVETLSRCPFMETLLDLELAVKGTKEEEEAVKFMAPLTALFQRAKSLKKLHLSSAPIRFSDIPFEKMEKLEDATFKGCEIYDDAMITLPPLLLSLDLSCRFRSEAAFVPLSKWFNYPKVKIYGMRMSRVTEISDDEGSEDDEDSDGEGSEDSE